MIAFFAVWISSKPPGGGGCVGPGLVAKLLIVLAALSIAVEAVEWIYHQRGTIWPNYLMAQNNLSFSTEVLVETIIDDHFEREYEALNRQFPDRSYSIHRFLRKERKKYLHEHVYQDTRRSLEWQFFFQQLISPLSLPCSCLRYFFFTRQKGGVGPEVEKRHSELMSALRVRMNQVWDEANYGSDYFQVQKDKVNRE